MSIHTVPSRDFARDVGNAKRLADEGPVFITARGKPVYALLKIEDYYRLAGGEREMSLAELMESLPSTEGIEFEPPRVSVQLQVPQPDGQGD